MLLLALALSAAAPGAGWHEFDRRRRGAGETPAYYAADRVRRRGGRAEVWIRYDVLRSGRPDLRTSARVEIDCARRRSRTLTVIESEMPRIVDSDGARMLEIPQPQLSRPGRRAAPIAAGSVDEALARRLCGGGPPPS
jgi:hypothetical protein